MFYSTWSMRYKTFFAVIRGNLGVNYLKVDRENCNATVIYAEKVLQDCI
jgi:hypothetical protein